MMPQKKNPDIPELIRGKTGRIFGHLMALLTTVKALPLTYNKDMQEDKEGVSDTVKTITHALTLMKLVLDTVQVNKDRMQENIDNSFVAATDLADYLVRKGIPFREAHEIVGRIVLYCIQNEKRLHSCTIEEFQSFSSAIDTDVFVALQTETVIEARRSEGGTSRQEVEKTLRQKRETLEKVNSWMTNFC